MEYIAILKQSGGCDYTIGCGMGTYPIEANSMEEAKATLLKMLYGRYNPEFVTKEEEDEWGKGFLEMGLTSVELLEVNRSERLGISKLNKNYTEAVDDKTKEVNAEREHKQYMRLKEKFEN